MRLSSCISLDLLYIHNGDEPSENSYILFINIIGGILVLFIYI